MTDSELLQLEYLLELDEIDKARESFWAYCQYTDSSFFTDDKIYLKEIADAYQAVYEGKINKLIVELPPRAGKSYITSKFCAWYFGKLPRNAIMRNTYGAGLAHTFSRHIRNFVQDDKHLKVFPESRLKADQQAVDDWALESAKVTSYFCAGVGGAITGKGCNLGLLDDPIKNWQDATSPTVRNTTWDWYLSTHRSRFESGTPEIIVATRWNLQDPTGLVLENEPGEWTEIKYAALNKDGKSFCESVKTTDEYLSLKKITPSPIWEAEFQQNPIEATGLLFPSDSLSYYTINEFKPSNTKAGYLDIADEGSDYLCSIIGFIIGEKCYIHDVVFTQEPVELTKPKVANQIIKYNPQRYKAESNFGGRQYALSLQDLVSGKSASKIEWQANTVNKETRILMASEQIKQNFIFRSDYEAGSDYDIFMRQLTSYSKSGKNEHDDAADACTGLSELVFERYKTIWI